MVFQLDNELWFPDPRQAEEDGLLARGGDLSTDRLLLAYANGIFPWYAFEMYTEPMWYCPQNRFVIFPSEIHVSHSMRTLMAKKKYYCTINRDFESVISFCSCLRIEERGAWLGDEMVKAYTELHRQGFAASVEVWLAQDNVEEDEEVLVGGLYGVTIGKSFFGESMFSMVPDASKLALILLARFMEQNGGALIDCQFETPHLRSMGGRSISYDEYMRIISDNT